MTAASELKDRTQELKNRDQWSNEDYQVLSRLRPRYFSPREIANFLCFPATYSVFIQYLSPMPVYPVSICKNIVNIMYFKTKRELFDLCFQVSLKTYLKFSYTEHLETA